MKLRELGEDRLLAEFLPNLPSNFEVLAPAGDDCAVVKAPRHGNLLLLKTDCVVEGVHFTSTTAPEAVGWKAMARPLSDFAAMSGLPQFALITLIAPRDTTLDWTRKVYRGLRKAARRFGVAIVGGETSGTRSGVVISVSITGFVEPKRWIARAGGKPNDELFVTGRLGGSRREKHLKFVPRIVESRWLTENFRVHAMMDLSDGLGADLPRLARASDLGFQVDEETLPRSRGCTIDQAINDGEDYELLFAISPASAESLTRKWHRQFPKLPLTRIGRLMRRSKIADRKFHGFVHFK